MKCCPKISTFFDCPRHCILLSGGDHPGVCRQGGAFWWLSPHRVPL